MADGIKSKAFADLVVSMSEADQAAMAMDVLEALSDDGSIPPKRFSISEIKRAAGALLSLAHDIHTRHPGGHSW